jgi:hypothetical protein
MTCQAGVALGTCFQQQCCVDAEIAAVRSNTTYYFIYLVVLAINLPHSNGDCFVSLVLTAADSIGTRKMSTVGPAQAKRQRVEDHAQVAATPQQSILLLFPAKCSCCRSNASDAALREGVSRRVQPDGWTAASRA